MMTKRLPVALSLKRCAGVMIPLFTLCLQLSSPGRANGQTLQTVNVAIPSKSFQMVIYPLAKERGFMKEEGIDLNVIYIAPVTSIQAMLGGSIDVSQVGGAAAVSAIAQGAEVAILGTVFTRLTFAIHASPQIKQLSDLKGKTIAAGAIGGNSYFAGVLFASKMGWVPNRDVGIMAVGGSPEGLAGLG